MFFPTLRTQPRRRTFCSPNGMLEKVARIGTILSLLCLGWLLPGMFSPPRCSKSALVQSFDIRTPTALSRVWNCAIESSGTSIASDHLHRLRDLENRLRLLEIVINWHKLPKHLFRPEFNLSLTDEEMETALVESYVQAQPELAREIEYLLPRLALDAFGGMEFRPHLWSPLESTLLQARLYHQLKIERERSFADRLKNAKVTPGKTKTLAPTPSLTVAQIDSRLSRVYATWRRDQRILLVRGSPRALNQSLHLFGASLLVQSEECEFSAFLNIKHAGGPQGGPRKVVWIPRNVHVAESLIQVLNENGTRAFAERSSSKVPFIEMYFPHVKQEANLGRIASHQPLLDQLLQLSKATQHPFDNEVHQPATTRDLVTLYRWPTSP